MSTCRIIAHSVITQASFQDARLQPLRDLILSRRGYPATGQLVHRRVLLEQMEPWLTGRFAPLQPIPRFLCCSLELSLSDVRKWTEPLTNEQIWTPQANNTGSVGFQLRHLAGSVDRLLTYAREEALTPQQLAFLKSEAEPGAPKEILLKELETAYAAATQFAQTAMDYDSPRYIGRQRLETPLGVLLSHIAEHTQRHTGQLIVLAKFAYTSHR